MSEFMPRAWEDVTTAAVAWVQANPDVRDGAQATDLVPGSLERAHIEAFAVQVETVEHRTAEAFGRAIRESAYHAFGFDLLPAKIATGFVTFSRFDALAGVVTIPVGTLVIAVTGAIFETTQTGTIALGDISSPPVPVRAQVAGLAGNLPPASLTRMATGGSGVDQVTNINATGGGADQESEDMRAARFQAFIKTVPRGTSYALEYAALSTGLVVAARAVDPCTFNPRPAGIPYAGQVWLFCDPGDGSGVFSPGVQSTLDQTISGYISGGVVYPGWKAAGVQVAVTPSQNWPVKVRGRAHVTPGGVGRWTAISLRLKQTAQTYFDGLRIGQPISYRDLTAALQLCDPDIKTVVLDIWSRYGVVPSRTADPLVLDLDPFNVTIPLSAGYRPTLYTGTDPDGVAGAAIAYPEWIMVEG